MGSHYSLSKNIVKEIIFTFGNFIFTSTLYSSVLIIVFNPNKCKFFFIFLLSSIFIFLFSTYNNASDKQINLTYLFYHITITAENNSKEDLMPFTFSHPAIVLPLKKLSSRWFSTTGLIIGSMVPDFEYFIRMKTAYSHEISSILWLNLPIGILTAFIFHNIIRNALIDNLPYFLKIRIYTLKDFNWNQYFKKNWYIVIYSFIIGIVSHLFWDSFTHWNGYFAKHVPILKEYLYLFGKKYHYLRILYYISSILGILFIILYINNITLNKNVPKSKNSKYWILLLVFFLSITLLRYIIGFNFNNIWNIVVNCISSFFLALLIISLWELKYHNNKKI